MPERPFSFRISVFLVDSLIDANDFLKKPKKQEANLKQKKNSIKKSEKHEYA
jgi:hypothetical protein